MIDFRSDTITQPTEEMRKEMFNAKVGDDVYRDDVTVNKLEEISAEILGKESALYVPSGTMGNLLALMTHTQPGQEIVVGEQTHIYLSEVTGYARLCGLGAKVIKERRGIIEEKEIEEKILKGFNIHYRNTGLICIENSHNISGGIVSDLNYMRKVRNISNKYNIPVHLDGARLFNAATYLETDVKNITNEVDSVMVCLSKGLGAPIGSMLAGKKDFIEEARHNRKMLGGGMRQVGILAAAGIVAITKMTKRLNEDHENAQLLAKGISKIEGLDINLEDVHTNIVMVNVNIPEKDSNKLCEELKKENILSLPFGPKRLRFLTNFHVKRNDVENTIEIMNNLYG